MYTLIETPTQTSSILLEDILNKMPYTLLYFYPKDNTPGCTTEATDFTKLQKDFQTQNVQIIGVSKDSPESHCNFQDKHKISIPLISDPERILHKQFNARGEKNMYGKIIQGVIRSTFLLDKSGKIIHERKNVRAKGHAERVLTRTKQNIS